MTRRKTHLYAGNTASSAPAGEVDGRLWEPGSRRCCCRLGCACSGQLLFELSNLKPRLIGLYTVCFAFGLRPFGYVEEFWFASGEKVFNSNGEKIEGDGTDLTISGNNINLTATADVNIPSDVGLTFATNEKIESDGTDLNITVGAGGDINIPANIGLTFGDDGEKIEGDGTDLTITGNNINLTATADVVVPANVGIIFGTGEKIEGDDTDLTITSGADINLTATSDINIPANIGLSYGEKENFYVVSFKQIDNYLYGYYNDKVSRDKESYDELYLDDEDPCQFEFYVFKDSVLVNAHPVCNFMYGGFRTNFIGTYLKKWTQRVI